MNPALSATAEQRLDLTMALLGGIVNGVVMSPTSRSNRTDLVNYAQGVADENRNACFAMAGSLMALNQELHPNNPTPARARAVATLCAASISGLIAAGTRPADALTQTNRQRERMFAMAQRALNQAMDAPAPDVVPPRLDLARFRDRHADSPAPVPPQGPRNAPVPPRM